MPPKKKTQENNKQQVRSTNEHDTFLTMMEDGSALSLSPGKSPKRQPTTSRKGPFDDGHDDEEENTSQDISYHLISQAPFMLTQNDFESYGQLHGSTAPHQIAQFNDSSLRTNTAAATARKRGRPNKNTPEHQDILKENHILTSNSNTVGDFNFDPNILSAFQLEKDPDLDLKTSKKSKRGVIQVAPSSNPLAVEKPRRAKRIWTAEEEQNLNLGVEKYGLGNWAKIRDDPDFSFQEGRSSVDLKDKWRNLTSFKSYKEHDVRKYVLLNERHEFLLTTAKTGKQSGCHYFQNRWPREAALKVAARDEFYASSEDSGPIMIYLRETKPPQPAEDKEEVIVHVYKGRRERRIAVDIPKFKNKEFMWEPYVIKVREERLSSGHYAVVPAHELPEDLQTQAADFSVQFDGLF